jgi:hypothetical protein
MVFSAETIKLETVNEDLSMPQSKLPAFQIKYGDVATIVFDHSMGSLKVGIVFLKHYRLFIALNLSVKIVTRKLYTIVKCENSLQIESEIRIRFRDAIRKERIHDLSPGAAPSFEYVGMCK